ncbi:MAG: ATP-dependent Clp protease ATP-binding subunit, partial [Rikenellaceae bacterium]|nr:ATP-dependent Clp protease ATP-binding subunit [Rikenellaceae bacterium]
MAQFGINAHTIASIIREIGDRAEGMFSPVAYHITQANSDQQENISHDALLLPKFGVNLTRHAREGKIDPVIGRNKEIDRVIQILLRRKKNNPVLIGEAGVGKSAIVEGLALRIATGTAPHALSNKEIYSIDMAALVAGTKFRGEFEERMQQLLDELRNAHDVIVFIDEIHTIVGAGASQGSLDTANILKPSLARGEIRLIGATTLDEYRDNIECDSALERRFQRVIVEPTTTAQTLKIVQNIAPYYEQYHNVKYTEDALRACVMLTERYITDRHFPDKAIDLMDEAGARSRIRSAQKSEPMRST